MRNLALAVLVMSVMGLALWAYTENYATRVTLDKVTQLNKEIVIAQSRVRVLNAEWAYLNRPERLMELANANFADLRLLQLTSDHFARIEQIPFPDADLGPIARPIEVMNRENSQ